ncbi:Chemosensory protein, partial [Operophtera brumata]
LLPEALRTKCIRCTERQKRTAVKIITRLKYEYPEEWAKLSTRWDSTGDFTRYFEEPASPATQAGRSGASSTLEACAGPGARGHDTLHISDATPSAYLNVNM